MTTSFILIRLPPERDSSDLIEDLARDDFHFSAVSNRQEITRFMKMSQETTAGASSVNQLSRTAEIPALFSLIREPQCAEGPDPESINVLELLIEDDVKKEEITDDDYGFDKCHQLPTWLHLVGSGRGITGEATAYKNDVEMSSVDPELHKLHSVEDVKEECDEDLPPTSLPVGAATSPNSNPEGTKRKYFVVNAANMNEGTYKIRFPVKTVPLKRQHENPFSVAGSILGKYPQLISWVEPCPNEVKIGDSIRARGLMKQLPMPQQKPLHKPTVSKFRSEKKPTVPKAPSFPIVPIVMWPVPDVAGEPTPTQHNWPVNRLLQHLDQGPFFALNFTSPLEKEHVPSFLENFCYPRGIFPGTPCCPGSLFFFAQIRLEDHPWLYLCPKAIYGKLRYRRFVFYSKFVKEGLIPALFQYIIEAVDSESSENTQVLKCKTIEVDAPPSTDPTLKSIISGLKSKGIFQAPSVLTPLGMDVIPTILKWRVIVLAEEIPLDFSKSYSLFRISNSAEDHLDGYSPWQSLPMSQGTADGGATVRRYDFIHSSNRNFKRFMFTIGSKANNSEVFLFQYVVDGPMRHIPWKRLSEPLAVASSSNPMESKKRTVLLRTSSFEDDDARKSAHLKSPALPPPPSNQPGIRPANVESIMARLMRNGSCFARNFTTPLDLDVIPEILKNREEFVLRGGRLVNFDVRGSFFQITRANPSNAIDGYSPWNYHDYVHLVTSGVVVTRYRFTHPSNIRFRRYKFSIGKKDNQSLVVVNQYVVDGPIPEIPWKTEGRLTILEDVRLHSEKALKSKTKIQHSSHKKIELDMTVSAKSSQQKSDFQDVDASIFAHSKPSLTPTTMVTTILAGLRSTGSFHASSLITPLMMDVIPRILAGDTEKTVVDKGIPVDFRKSGSFFRVFCIKGLSAEDHYSPWISKNWIQKQIGGVVVTRYSFTHPFNENFRRFMFTIGSKDTKGTDEVLNQYVLERPISEIPWQKKTCRKIWMMDETDADKKPDEVLSILNAPRSTSTRVVKLPSRYQK